MDQPTPALSTQALIGKIRLWALDQRLTTAATTALGLPRSMGAWRSLVKDWQSGDLRKVPKVTWLDDAALGGARGAYTEGGLIALNYDWATYASSSELEAVFAEELGHWLDARFNSTDTPGDEGERFAAALLGLDCPDLANSENDQIKIRLNNAWVSAEAQASSTPPTTT